MKVVLQDEFDRIVQHEVPGLPTSMREALVASLVGIVQRNVKVANRLTILKPHEAAQSTVVEWHIHEMAREIGLLISKDPAFCTVDFQDDDQKSALWGDTDPTPGKQIRMSIRAMSVDCVYRLVDPLRKFRTKP